ncbi:MAG TPA: SDR family NAD(P)-dependent oxidoreductase [Planctomycetota bacterium]|nr:SDR family NAD(P)-dependent oxidoreductase [Planctomycetota bacterium]
MPGKLIVITGCTRGLGRAMVDKFIALDHTVIGCGRNKKDIAALAKQYSAPHDFTALDVASDSDVKGWAERVLKSHGAPDFLLNNAALMNPVQPLWTIAAKDFDALIDVNIKGVANTIRHFVPAMVKRGTGVIANFSSGWGRSTSPNVAAYCASKYAIEGLSQALAQELPSGMCCVPLSPGVINTDMLRQAWGDGASSYQDPASWAEKAVPYILRLSTRDNGRSLSTP